MQTTQHEAKAATLPSAKPKQKPAHLFKPGQSGNPAGRKTGAPTAFTRSLKEAVEIAARDCHPQGLAGWLVDRANGGVQDRAIFATMVAKVIPIQVNQSVQGGISINLNWLGGRAIGTVSAQPKVIDAQTVELIQHSEPERWIADGKQGEPAAQGLQDAQGVRTSADTERNVIVDPAPSEGPSRGIGDDPPSPLEAGPGGPA